MIFWMTIATLVASIVVWQVKSEDGTLEKGMDAALYKLSRFCWLFFLAQVAFIYVMFIVCVNVQNESFAEREEIVSRMTEGFDVSGNSFYYNDTKILEDISNYNQKMKLYRQLDRNIFIGIYFRDMSADDIYYSSIVLKKGEIENETNYFEKNHYRQLQML